MKKVPSSVALGSVWECTPRRKNKDSVQRFDLISMIVLTFSGSVLDLGSKGAKKVPQEVTLEG